jgi:hypothetical protein
VLGNVNRHERGSQPDQFSGSAIVQARDAPNSLEQNTLVHPASQTLRIKGTIMSQYASKQKSASVTRKATPDELWLDEQLERINPDCLEMGSSLALESLVFELRAKNQKLEGEASVMRALLGEVIDFVDQEQAGAGTLINQIYAALRGA